MIPREENVANGWLREENCKRLWGDGCITPSASDLIDLSKAYEMTMDEMLYKDVEPPAYDDEEGAYMNGIMPVSKKGKRKISFTKGEKIISNYLKSKG